MQCSNPATCSVFRGRRDMLPPIVRSVAMVRTPTQVDVGSPALAPNVRLSRSHSSFRERSGPEARELSPALERSYSSGLAWRALRTSASLNLNRRLMGRSATGSRCRHGTSFATTGMLVPIRFTIHGEHGLFFHACSSFVAIYACDEPGLGVLPRRGVRMEGPRFYGIA